MRDVPLTRPRRHPSPWRQRDRLVIISASSPHFPPFFLENIPHLQAGDSEKSKYSSSARGLCTDPSILEREIMRYWMWSRRIGYKFSWAPHPFPLFSPLIIFHLSLDRLRFHSTSPESQSQISNSGFEVDTCSRSHQLLKFEDDWRNYGDLDYQYVIACFFHLSICAFDPEIFVLRPILVVSVSSEARAASKLANNIGIPDSLSLLEVQSRRQESERIFR